MSGARLRIWVTQLTLQVMIMQLQIEDEQDISLQKDVLLVGKMHRTYGAMRPPNLFDLRVIVHEFGSPKDRIGDATVTVSPVDARFLGRSH